VGSQEWHRKSNLSLYGELANRVADNGAVGDHWVWAFAIESDLATDVDLVRLHVSPQGQEYKEQTVATFLNAQLANIVQTSHDPEDLSLPWGIRGFHCFRQADGKWLFNLNLLVSAVLLAFGLANH